MLLGTFLVKTKVGVTSFTFETSTDISVDSGTILKHGLSANDGVSEKGDENLKEYEPFPWQIFLFDQGQVYINLSNKSGKLMREEN